MSDAAKKRGAVQSSNREPFQMRMTRPREHTREGGELEIIVDLVLAEGAVIDQLRAVVDGFLGQKLQFHYAEPYLDQKTNVTRYKGLDRDMRRGDIRAATMIMHERLGDNVGLELAAPHAVINTAEGRKVLVDLDGKPMRTCRICQMPHEPFETLVAAGQEKMVHPSCWKRELRKMERQASQDLADRLAQSL